MDVISFINELFHQAIKQRASDIHIEPQADYLRIRQRIDGFLHQTDQVPMEFASAILSRLKVMAHLDIGEKRIPQDGAMSIHCLDDTVDVRLSTIPTLYGEKMVLRILASHSEAVVLEELGLEDEEGQRIEQLLRRSSGLLVVTGPTGSGKTTTLYAMMQKLNRTEINLVSLEDPIELQLRGINQIQVQPKIGFTFAQGLRAVLRQDPNVIMIGEIRDRETADIAIGAALTGHLVLSTLHTVDGASAITRLLDMNVEPYRIAASLSGVIAQRLVRLICIECKGVGCDRCSETGYRGRKGAFEVITIDEEVERMIIQKSTLTHLRQYFRQQGMRSLNQILELKVQEKQTTFTEYLRVMDDVEKEKMEV
ncbi:GspE/PulE family protein [Hazenella coriacea]|uniref:Type II secretion system protein E (GspE) n=1 Tax=Hazenella coriacea TaxID=1179467 RepID=A0A4R3L516_9BACL|nr:GspE/PulE family protein [Hazenella coriacea]TCS94709.1 type II secretion system protein E (GspE) [Hazenella coriacea]